MNIHHHLEPFSAIINGGIKLWRKQLSTILIFTLYFDFQLESHCRYELIIEFPFVVAVAVEFLRRWCCR